MDYVMTETRNEEYLSQFTPELIAFVDAMPSWMIAVWAIGVWGGVLGSLLLLLKKRFAVPVFIASCAATVIMAVRNYLFENGMEVMGDTFSLVFTAVIFLFTLGLVFYARAMTRQGVLQ